MCRRERKVLCKRAGRVSSGAKRGKGGKGQEAEEHAGEGDLACLTG